MTLAGQLVRLTRGMVLGLSAVLVAIGVAGCSSGDPSTPAPAVPTTIVMPDLVGMYWVDAEPKLRSIGWTGVLLRGPDMSAPQDRNRVITQSPPAGEQIDRDGEITLQFAS